MPTMAGDTGTGSGEAAHLAVSARLAVQVSDIARLEGDAIVNAADAELRAGGAVDQAIHRAAGPKLREECLAIGGCPTGEARLTGGYGLPARWVIHTVGPIYRDGRSGEPRLLASCYSESLRLAERNEQASLAFPAISTGAHGYPLDAAAEVAVRAVAAWLVAHALPERVVFCCSSEDDAEVYRSTLERFSLAPRGS